MEKTMKARVQHKHDIEANWLKATNFTPLASEIIVYDPDENYDYPRIKIGDGKTNINSLPFVTKDYAKISDIPTKPEDIGALPNSTVIPTVPTKISAFENDKGYLTQHQSLDAYAKTADLGALATKDSLTASDVGALPDTTKIPSALSDLTEDSTHRTVTDTEKNAWNGKANASDIPTKVSDLTNDKGYITSYTETDPTVPAWAKADTKPTYTASEVGALPSTTKIPSTLSELGEDSSHRVVTDVEKAAWNAKSNFSGSYNDLSNKPTIPSIDGLASTGYVDNAVKDKVDKDGNKVLSTNDYTTAEKNKLANIAAGAEVNVNADWNATSGDAQILNKPTLGSMAAKSSVAKSDLASGVQTSLGKADSALQPGDISDWAKQSSKPSYIKSEVGLGNVDNTSDANKPVSTAQASAIADAKKAGTDAQSNLTTHTNNKSNPHGVTKAQVGLGNVDNVRQYSASNPPVVTQAEAPTDTSVIWVDTDDNTVDEFQTDREEIINEVTSQLSLKILNQMTLGYHIDGLLYLFVNGVPVGTGVEFIGGATGDVTGVIDSVNNIILTGVGGDLPDGTYTIKYEKEDGTLVDGGNLVVSSGPAYTNLLPTSVDNTGAVYNGTGFKNGYRLTGGAYPCESAGAEFFCTGYIPYTKAQASARVPMYVKGITIDPSNVPKYTRVLMVDAYNTTDSYIDTLTITGDSGASNQITIQQLGDKYYKLTPNGGFITGNFGWKTEDLRYIRWSFPGTGNGVIFTVDEPIE